MRPALYFLIACMPALSVADPIAACRAAHAGDLEGYARCLEDELRALTAAPVVQSSRPDGKEKAPRAADSAPRGLGSEQVRDASEESGDEEASVVIVSATYDRSGLGTFRMEDGQVWRETSRSPTRRHLEPDRRYEARIERGKLGGYRLHVDGVRWMKTVRRIE